MTDFSTRERFIPVDKGELVNRLSRSTLFAAELDTAIEDWFAETYATPINFEIADALDKLKRLKLCHIVGNDQAGKSRWKALPLADACRQLDQLWDDFFQVHLPDAP